MIDWIDRLHKRGVFDGKRSVLELAPQDLTGLSVDDVVRLVGRITGAEASRSAIESKFFDNGVPRWWTATPDFYAVLGLKEYYAADLNDKRAEYLIDLNRPTMLPRKFDVITDFGTLEHVFNIGNGIKFIHDHLELGGIALHVLPAFGDYNHGFYNIHSTFFKDVAAANGYELIDIAYVPDVGRQNFFRDKGDSAGRARILDAQTIGQDRQEQEFAKAVLERRNGEPRTFDYLHAAYRKTSDSEFVYPMQAIYSDSEKYRVLAGDERSQKQRLFDVYLGRASGYLDSQNREEAEMLIHTALALASDNSNTAYAHQRLFDVYMGAARAHMKGQRWAEAERLIQAARALKPDDANVSYSLGLVCWKTGRLTDAVSLIERVCELVPGDVEAFSFLALLRADLAAADPGRRG
jgi:tetratricopeptide (TPR) repeat protein